jgi:hypothetical protein
MGDLLEIWQGGFRLYGEDQLDTIKEAFYRFQLNNDTKTSGAASFTYAGGQVSYVLKTSLLNQTDTINSW